MTRVAPLRFWKMHGAGNDFLVLDRRGGLAPPDAARVRALADRHTGVGFDQLITIEDSDRPGCVAGYRIWNADGAPARQCGNGARCVALWLHRHGVATGEAFRLDSPAGEMAVAVLAPDRFEVDMGAPVFAPARIPLDLAPEAAHYVLPLPGGPLRFGAVSMGNPHAVVEVDDVAAAPVETVGPALQARREFGEGVNVGFAQVLAPDRIALRVYERGAGETLACGSGACAAVAVLVRQGRVGRRVAVQLPGGTLDIHWPDDGAGLRMAGPAALVFEGELAGA